MRLFFDHTAGRITHVDWQYSTMLATFLPDEHEAALETGWLMNEWDPPFWFQARQVRYSLKDLTDLKKFKYPQGVTFKVIPVSPVQFNKYNEIWETYLAFKGFEKKTDFKESLDFEPENKKVIEIYDKDYLVAFSIIRISPGPVSLQFAWNYHRPKISLGMVSQRFEMEYLKSRGFSHHYVCPGYETTCIWKKRFPGFEFWTGVSWSTDRELYEKLCNKDSEIINADELFDLDSITENERPALCEWELSRRPW